MTHPLKYRCGGSYQKTPFFDRDTGAPVAAPQVLSADELSRFKRAVDEEINR
jgi:hypothetical protein